MSMQKHRRLFAACILILYISISVFCFSFIIKEADHNCSGAGCEVCSMIAQAENTLRTLGTGLLLCSFVFLSVCNIFENEKLCSKCLLVQTLVSQKIRLNN